MTERNETKSTIIGPLNFSPESDAVTAKLSANIETNVQCLFCDSVYTFHTQKDEYLAHLYLEHRLIIGDEEQVAIFDEYLKFWREKFDGDTSKLTEYCTTMIMDQLPNGTPSKGEKYYLLCDVLPQDNELRRNLHVKRLEMVLAQHQFERTDTTFERNCLYCRDIVKSTRADFLEHLFSKHFLQLGKSENLVFIDELIDTVQEKMTALICLFCEKQFKDRPTLKEHMRKKGHKRINPDNKNYDKFFLVNYKNEREHNCGQRTKHKPKRIQTKNTSNCDPATKYSAPTTKTNAIRQQTKDAKDSTVFDTNDSDSDWSDWEGDKQTITCLFCSHNDTDFTLLKDHIREEHHVDFDRETANLSFYDRVKIVNYVRRQLHMKYCIRCDANFETVADLQAHLKTERHCCLGERKQWDLPTYFFPTYEDDAFLCSLDDTNDTDFEDNSLSGLSKCDDASIVVHSEDPKICINSEAEALSKEQLLEF